MTVEIIWDGLDRPAWEALFASAGRSTLVQSWAWGEAKAALEGWVPRRAEMRLEGKTVALAQVLEKRLGGIVRVGRLNRGPVWLFPVPEDECLAAVQALRARWRVWRLAALSLAPELPATAAAGLRRLNLRPRPADNWCSAWLDLSQGAEVLRKRLDGKWRNMLVASEKAGLTVEAASDRPALDWLLERYSELLAQKGFGGTPPAVIRTLADHAFRPDDLLVLRALADGEPVAGILLARHGNAATYLIGWNGAVGRKLKANNRLLWEAMLELPRHGVRHLDLGGIDDRLTPGIASFKRGMNGEEYLLAGEWLGF
jgi:hypothetical protein